ncbi:MAG: hypothetical protein WC889_05270 [Myxococcota bacterium]
MSLLVLAAIASLLSCSCSELNNNQGVSPDAGSGRCTIDKQCPADHKCKGNRCVANPVSCVFEADCDGGVCDPATNLCVFGTIKDGGVRDSGQHFDDAGQNPPDAGDMDDSGVSEDAGSDAGSFDSGVDTDAGLPPGCLSDCDCDQGQGCNGGSGECVTVPGHQFYCCEKAGCPAGNPCQHVSGVIDFCAPAGAVCSGVCDCPQGLSCMAGKCKAGTKPEYCCDRLGCPNGAQCKDRMGTGSVCEDQTGWECVKPCDCMHQHQDCKDHLCVADDTIPYCCDLPNCKNGETCIKADGVSTSACGACSSDCDCPQGLMCAGDMCVAMGTPKYCCTKAGCPAGADCETAGGDPFGTCPGTIAKCFSDCDCQQGWFCESAKCKEDIMVQSYCCELPGCPEYSNCKDRNGNPGKCPTVAY